MKSVFDTKTGSDYVRAVRSTSRVMIFFVLASFLFLSLVSGPAWSFETYYGRMNDNSAIAADPSSVLAPHSPSRSGKSAPILADHNARAIDSCRPLLSSIRAASPHNAMDRHNRPSSAEKAAALGLIFGVRFALTPSGTAPNRAAPKARFDVWQPDTTRITDDGGSANRSALAVAAYRQCQKQKALQALSDFRWAR